jgi:hypothetical protein
MVEEVDNEESFTANRHRNKFTDTQRSPQKNSHDSDSISALDHAFVSPAVMGPYLNGKSMTMELHHKIKAPLKQLPNESLF